MDLFEPTTIFYIITLVVYVWACSVITMHRSSKFSSFEAFMMNFLFTPIVGALINILAKLPDAE